MRINLLLRPAAVLLVFASAFSQTQNSKPAPAEESPDMPVLRVSVNLVQLDAVVTDHKGKQVTNLTADDFQVFQDGKQQKITHFSYISTAANTPVPVAPAPKGKQVPGAAPAPPPVKLRTDQVRRTFAMVVDDLGLSFESTAQVRKMLNTFVDKQMQPGDLAAVIRTGAGMGAFQQFTSDKNMLHAAIDQAKFNAFRRTGFGGGGGQGNGFRNQYFTMGTIAAINFVIAGLKDMPGRKAVVLMSDNLNIFSREGLNDQILQQMRQLTDAANRASVVIYGIDARGLPTLSMTAEEAPRGRKNLTGPGLAKMQQRKHDQYFQSQDGLNYLAHETGGLFIHDTNDLAGGMREILDDQKGYYLIGYTPDDVTFQQLKSKERPYHKLSVKVKGTGLSIRSRSGFFGVPDQNTKPVYDTPQQQLFAALGSPFGGGGVHLQLTALFANNDKEGSFVQSMLHIDGKDVTFTDEPDGWHKVSVDIIVATFDDRGAVVDSSSKTYNLTLRGDTFKLAVEHGFTYTLNHPVKKPGPYQLRTAVRDVASNKIGSASQFIEVPDLTKGHLTLSGIVVRASRPPAPAPANPPAEAPPISKEEAELEALGNPAVRMFYPGRKVEYALQVLNAHEEQLESQLFLFHDGKQVYAGKLQPLKGQKAPDGKSLFAAGQLQLGSKMEPGEYAMQIVVTDNLAQEKFRTVAQSIDFELVK